MEMERRSDRLSDLPESILLYILSMVGDSKQVVRTSLVSTKWRYLWKYVPVSLEFTFPDTQNQTLNYVAYVHRELCYWKSCQKIEKFIIWQFRYEVRYVKFVDLWVHFAMRLANVKEFTLGLFSNNDDLISCYHFPQFAFNNSSLRDLNLRNCKVNPYGSVNWNNLFSLKIGHEELTDVTMQKILSGCPNLDTLELESVSGLRRLEITSVKLRELMLEDYYDNNHDICLEIVAPHLTHLEILGLSSEIRIGQRTNVASLNTVVFRLNFDFEDEEENFDKEFSYLNNLLHCVAHVENLELGTWCIKGLSILDLKGLRPSPSSRKFLELNLALDKMDFPGIYSFLQSSSDLETLVISCWYNHKTDMLSRYTNEDEMTRRFEMQNVNCSFSHLKTIKIDSFNGSIGENKYVLQLVKYLLKHATMLEEFVIAATFLEMSTDYAEMAQKFLSFPMSSPHASMVFLDLEDDE